jgi:hypothetical protein
MVADPPRLLSVDIGSMFDGGEGGDRVSLEDGPHVEAWFLIERFAHRQADLDAHAVAQEWLREHKPTPQVYRSALAAGAKPLSLRLSRAQAVLLERASAGEIDIDHREAKTARALLSRGLLMRTDDDLYRLSAWGALWLRSQQRQKTEHS